MLENITLNFSNSLDKLLKLHEMCPFITLKDPHDFRNHYFSSYFASSSLFVNLFFNCMVAWADGLLPSCFVLSFIVLWFHVKGKASCLLSLPGKDSRGHSNEKNPYLVNKNKTYHVEDKALFIVRIGSHQLLHWHFFGAGKIEVSMALSC